MLKNEEVSPHDVDYQGTRLYNEYPDTVWRGNKSSTVSSN